VLLMKCGSGCRCISKVLFWYAWCAGWKWSNLLVQI